MTLPPIRDYRITEVTSSLLTAEMKSSGGHYYDLTHSGELTASFNGHYRLDIEAPEKSKNILLRVIGSDGSCEIKLPRRIWDKLLTERLEFVHKYDELAKAWARSGAADEASKELDRANDQRGENHRQCVDLLRQTAEKANPAVEFEKRTTYDLVNLLANLMAPELSKNKAKTV